MIFDEITIHNFGTYIGRQTVSLKPKNEKKPIVLFGGLNGSGKTTLLDAFYLALFGKFADCSNRGALAYEKFLLKCIHKSVSPEEGAAVSIKFRHSINGMEQTYHVNRYWKLNKKTISEKVEVLCNGKYDSVITDAWYEHIEQFIPLRISNLFFFDGEKIEDFASFGKSSELISTGINQLLGLDLISQLIVDLRALEKREKINHTDNINKQRIDSIENVLRDLTKQKEDLGWQVLDSEKKIRLLKDQIKEIDEKFRLEGGDLYLKREELESKKSAAIEEMTRINNELLDVAGSELPMVVLKNNLMSILHQAKKEEAATANENIYEILKKRDSSITHALKKKGIPNKFLTELVDILKNDLNERLSFNRLDKYLNIDSETKILIKYILDESFDVIISAVKELIIRKNNVEEEIENFDRRLANIPDEEAIVSLLDKKERNSLSLQEIELNHDILLKELQGVKNSLVTAERELEKELERELDTEYQHESALRVVKYSEKSRMTLETFKEKIIKHHIENIQMYVLDAFRQIMRKEHLILDLKIDPKTYKPLVIGSDCKPIELERLSAGERQLLAVSFLWGLAKASGRSLPTIIDTPLGRLDATHRTHLVNRYFPFASHQVLLLSTDEEITEKYYRMLKPYISHEYSLMFNESEQSTTIEKGYFWE